MQRADLLGLMVSGAPVTFECKVGNDGYTPLASLLEGPDTCLLLSGRLECTKPNLSNPPYMNRNSFHTLQDNEQATAQQMFHTPYYKQSN